MRAVSVVVTVPSVPVAMACLGLVRFLTLVATASILRPMRNSLTVSVPTALVFPSEMLRMMPVATAFLRTALSATTLAKAVTVTPTLVLWYVRNECSE